MYNLLRSSAVAVALLGVSVLPSAAVTIPIGGPNTAIGLGAAILQDASENPSASFTLDYFFNLTAPGLLSANALEGTAAGSNAINPFTLTLEVAGGAVLATSSAPTANGSTENIQLSNVAPLTTGVNYELVVTGTVSSLLTQAADISGNIFIQPTPLPGALPLFASGIFGFWAWRRKRKDRSAGLPEAAAA
jgi:hypothetical protein